MFCMLQKVDQESEEKKKKGRRATKRGYQGEGNRKQWSQGERKAQRHN